MRYSLLTWIPHFIFLQVIFFAIPAVSIAKKRVKTPSDVFLEVQLLKENIISLRKKIGAPKFKWSRVSKDQIDKRPRHVLQKALEVLNKINRIRVYENLGSIPIPQFPARKITPNDVYYFVLRLNKEVELLLEKKAKTLKITSTQNKTPSDVYFLLKSISHALDHALGIRAVNPGEVYAKSEDVLKLIKYIRTTQNLRPEGINKPEKTEGKHPNHSLQEAYQLMARVKEAQKSLGIESIKMPKLPKRVITPSDVYDTIQIVIAELQNIKFRLGVERDFQNSNLSSKKTPDDVIQNIRYASILMPTFSIKSQLIEHEQEYLIKDQESILVVSNRIIDKLKLFKQKKGIKRKALHINRVYREISPHHVYEKTLENMKKMAKLREIAHLGRRPIPEILARELTPTEIYELTIRLEDELDSIYIQTGLLTRKNLTTLDEQNIRRDIPRGTQPVDVYFAGQKISALIDSIHGQRAGRYASLKMKNREVSRED